jgi:hypothetical protein
MCFMRAVWAQSFPRYPYRVASVFACSMLSSMLTLPNAALSSMLTLFLNSYGLLTEGELFLSDEKLLL